MKALRFHNSAPRLTATFLLGRITKSAYVWPTAPIRFEDIPEPELPAGDWVRVRPRLAGICGSDSKQVFLNGAFDNPLTALVTLPHVLGHEAVATIVETGPAVCGRKAGERVLINPWLPCAARGIHPVCSACADGNHMLCRNFTEGTLPPGIHLGNNARVPGAFAESFVAHESQCIPLSDEISDDQAVLADPFSVSLHSVVNWPPPAGEPVLVWGLGTLGLMAVAALAKLYPDSPIYAVGRYPHQRDLALRFGAREVFEGKQVALIEHVARRIGAKLMRPWSGVPWLLDGVGVVYDTVGAPRTVETAIRLVRARGTVVVSGVEIPQRFEWTPLYFKEVSLVGSNAFAVESFRGRRVHAMQAYLELVGEGLDVTPLITHRFPLNRWREAFLALAHRGESKALKVCFDFP
ncbi:MAG: alcohol dehydrogenase [Candidatus Hydrogenedentota bacterium]